ncbi:MAG: hypothetical protein Q8Q10_00070 [bacterium]|nr:hypothetical protein [bacterium]
MEPDMEVKTPKNASDVFVLFIEIIKAKFSIFFRVFKKFRIILSLLFLCSFVSVIYLLFTNDSTGMSRIYAVIPIVILLIVYLLLRAYVIFRSQIEVTNQVYAKLAQDGAEEQPQSLVLNISAKLFSRSNLNILTYSTFFIVIAFLSYLIIVNILR